MILTMGMFSRDFSFAFSMGNEQHQGKLSLTTTWHKTGTHCEQTGLVVVEALHQLVTAQGGDLDHVAGLEAFPGMDLTSHVLQAQARGTARMLVYGAAQAQDQGMARHRPEASNTGKVIRLARLTG